MNKAQLALIKKDIRAVTSNKRIYSVMLIVPLVLTVFLPSVFIFTLLLLPESMTNFDLLLKLLPLENHGENLSQVALWLLLNKIMPIFFMIIPIMASSVVAASSFVGEKEKRTLETLLYSPLSLGQLFQAKILACFSLGLLVSVISLVAMMVVVEIELLLMTGSCIIPDLGWPVIMLLIAPALSLISINITVRSSAKAQTIEEAQQRSVFLVLPIVALAVSQFTGVVLISTWLLLGLGIVLAIPAIFLTRSSLSKYTYETLLK